MSGNDLIAFMILMAFGLGVIFIVAYFDRER